jgi:hypothetical protein
MSIATFSLPIDIPWRRIAFSEDMMDLKACNRELPLRWRSSLAVFEYEPPDDQQRLDGFKVSYLKVACTITGYQPNGREIRIRERIARSGWRSQSFSPGTKQSVNLTDLVDTYHACYGAMLEVVVAPPERATVEFKDYPYFADFDPKKRELYEAVTETGEVLSRSLDDVGVRLGQTTSQSHEVMDKTSLGATLTPGPTGGLGGSIGSESRTTDLSQRATENVRTTDAAREMRETLSHTTQLSQMYHQLNSYHLGTNRAAFFVSPRPHIVQANNQDGTPRTFVDGPRSLEGIQEFMLVVVRPKSQEHICVEAYLETAHRVQAVPPPTDEEITDTFVFPRVGAEVTDDTFTQIGLDGAWEYHKQVISPPYTPPTGYVVDTQRPGGAYKIISQNPANPTNVENIVWTVLPNRVSVSCKLIARVYHFFDDRPVTASYPAFFELAATIYLKKIGKSRVTDFDDTLLITGRAVCSCGGDRPLESLPFEKDLSIVYETKIKNTQAQMPGRGRPIPIHEANQLGVTIHREILQSLTSADRYPRGTVSLLDTQLVAETLAARLHDADRNLNTRLDDCPGIEETITRRIMAYSPSITRAHLLQMPLTRQVEIFGLSFTEAVKLRRSLTDLKEPKEPPPVSERRRFPMPSLIGMQIYEARGILAAADLLFGTAIEVDSSLPSGTVVTQEPAAGKSVEAGTTVSMKLASGLSVRLPEILGVGLAEAACRVRDAGLRSEPTIEGPPVPDARVVALEPPAGTWVTPNTPVTVRLERKR